MYLGSVKTSAVSEYSGNGLQESDGKLAVLGHGPYGHLNVKYGGIQMSREMIGNKEIKKRQTN